jgi:hypothetical protein
VEAVLTGQDPELLPIKVALQADDAHALGLPCTTQAETHMPQCLMLKHLLMLLVCPAALHKGDRHQPEALLELALGTPAAHLHGLLVAMQSHTRY